MIAAIEINEVWIAIPSAVVGIGFLIYALWPSDNGRRISLCFGSFLLIVAAVAYVAADPPASPSPRPSPNRPDPVVVVPVTPVAGSLAELVPAEVRGKIGRYYLSLADVIKDAVNLKTTEDLRNAHVSACLLMKTACDLPTGLSDFRDATDKLLTASLSLESQQLTPALREKFTNTCRQIAAELGVTQ